MIQENIMDRYDIVPKKGRGGVLFCKEAPNDTGKYIRYEDYVSEKLAMCKADSNAVLGEVRAELLHEAMGLLMNHEQRCEMDWIEDYEELVAKYSELFA